MLAAADVKRGAKLFKKCGFCHTITKIGGNIVDPNPRDTVGRRKAGAGNFSYSTAFNGPDGKWSYEELNTFLASHKVYAQGTRMKIKGLEKASGRVAPVAYPRTFSDSPKPLP
ncbi:MAG: hypothetical protein V3V55_01760 [Rhodospirillales bacterium]